MPDDAASSFALSTDDGLMAVGALAKRLGVSTQTVYNYAADGMTHVKLSADGEKLWDAAAAEEWVRVNKPPAKHGGKRDGAGKKGRRANGQRANGQKANRQIANGQMAKDQTQSQSEASDHATSDIAAPTLTLGALWEQIKAEGVAADDETAYIERFLATIKAGGLNPLEVRTFGEGIDAMKRFVELRLKAGQLVDKDEVATAYGEHLAMVRRVLEAAPDRYAAEIAAECQIPQDKVPGLRRVLGNLVENVLVQLEAEVGEE